MGKHSKAGKKPKTPQPKIITMPEPTWAEIKEAEAEINKMCYQASMESVVKLMATDYYVLAKFCGFSTAMLEKFAEKQGDVGTLLEEGRDMSESDRVTAKTLIKNLKRLVGEDFVNKVFRGLNIE
jgi:hypothetical protein